MNNRRQYNYWWVWRNFINLAFKIDGECILFLLEGFLFVCCMFVSILFLLLFLWDLLIYLVVVVVVTKMIVKFRICKLFHDFSTSNLFLFVSCCCFCSFCFGVFVVCCWGFGVVFFLFFFCFFGGVGCCCCCLFVFGGFFCLFFNWYFGFIYTSSNNLLNVPVIHVPDGIPITAVINMFTVIINRMLYCRIYSHSKVSFRFQRNLTKHNWVKWQKW